MLSASCVVAASVWALTGCANSKPWWSKDKDEGHQQVAQTPDQGGAESRFEDIRPPDPVDPVPGEPIGSGAIDDEPEPPTPVEGDDETPTDEPTHAAHDAMLDEVIRLYRRLHVELEPDGRNTLIVELLRDDRERVKLLGFDLASRDLGSGSTLDQETAQITIKLLDDPRPEVRLNAVRLLTRLALPDSMVLLGEALKGESDPRVAEALLRALERWPDANARDEVLAWYTGDPTIHRAAASAAWALAELGAWSDDEARTRLLDHARNIPDELLTAPDARLIATLDGASGVQRLLAIARGESSPIRNDVIDALTRTPSGVDPLLELIGSDPAYFEPMSRALIEHRASPEGFRILTALPAPSREVRRDAIDRMGSRLDTRDLDHAVRLARNAGTLDDELSIRVLQRLIASGQAIPARESPGVVLLATLELANARPDRAIEVLGFLPDSGVDPASTLRAASVQTTSMILLGEYDRAMAQGEDVQPWLDAIDLAPSAERKAEIASRILGSGSLTISDEQREQLESIKPHSAPSADDNPASQEPAPDTQDD